MNFMDSLNTFASSYVEDDDSPSVILVDQNTNSISDSELSDKFENINSSVFFVFSTNYTNAPDVLNATVKNDVGYRDPLSIILPISFCYFLILITGILGNVITCVVIAKNKTMHTATNYYLFNLAVSDFFVLIFGEWISGMIFLFIVLRRVKSEIENDDTHKTQCLWTCCCHKRDLIKLNHHE